VIDVGFVKVENFKRFANKHGYSYLLKPLGFVEKARMTKSFLSVFKE
jgi:hypothetical protein